MLEGVIVLEEFCKELAAITFVKHHAVANTIRMWKYLMLLLVLIMQICRNPFGPYQDLFFKLYLLNEL